MSAVFSNEVAVHMYLEEQAESANGTTFATSANKRMSRGGSSLLQQQQAKHGGSLSFRGSFSEVISRTKDDEQVIFDQLFPESIENKDRKTYYTNPLAYDSPNPEAEYVIPDPDDTVISPSRKSTKFATLLGLVFLVQDVVAGWSISLSIFFFDWQKGIYCTEPGNKKCSNSLWTWTFKRKRTA